MPDHLALFFAVNYFAQGMAGLAYEPISYLLKDELKLSAGQSAVFVAWMTLPFLMKPLFGVLSDLFPIAGRRRKPHLLMLSALAAISWLALAAQKAPAYGPLLLLLVLVNVGVVASDVVCDAVMVEQGKARRKTGLYQAVQIGTLYATLVLTGIGGGWLAARASARATFVLAVFFPMMVFASAFWIKEERGPRTPGAALKGMSALFSSRRFWALSLFIFLWSFYPFLGTAQFYYQSDVLKFSPVFIGFLSTLGGLAGVVGAAFYGKAIAKAWSTETLVKAAVVFGCPLSLLYLFYAGPVSACVVTFVLGVSGVAFRLALMDLAAQSCPASAEATAFSAYMAVFNLAASVSNTAGGKLYDVLRARLAAYPEPAFLAMAALSLVGSCCTLACWWLLPEILKERRAELPGSASDSTFLTTRRS